MKILDMIMLALNEAVNFSMAMKPKITGMAMYSQISAKFRQMGVKSFEIGDEYYKTTDLESLEKFNKYNISRIKKYSSIYDCENFSRVYAGEAALMIPRVPIGEIHVDRTKTKDRHSLNFTIMIDDDNSLELWYIEPQTGNMFNYNMGLAKGYKPYFINL